MKIVLFFILFASIFSMDPPKAPIHTWKKTYHKVELVDDYHWMSNSSHTDLEHHLQKEEKYRKSIIDSKLVAELVREETVRKNSSETTIGEYTYFCTFPDDDSDEKYPKWYQMKGTKRTLIFDENILVAKLEKEKGGELPFYEFGKLLPTTDGKKFAYTYDIKGTGVTYMYVKDVEGEKSERGPIHGVVGNPIWSNDNNYIILTKNSELLHQPMQLFIYKDEGKAIEVYATADSKTHIELGKTSDGNYITIDVKSLLQNSIYVIPATFSHATQLTLVRAPKENVMYKIDHALNTFFIMTREKYNNYGVGKINGEQIDYFYNGVEDKLLVEDFKVTKDYVMILSLNTEEALEKLAVYDVSKGGEAHEVDITDIRKDGEYYAINFDHHRVEGKVVSWENPNFSTDIFEFSYSSLITPHQRWKYTCSSKELDKISEITIEGYDREDFEDHLIWANSTDNVTLEVTKIPIFYMKPKKKMAKKLLHLSVYGSYGINFKPSFRHDLYDLIKRGFQIAVTNPRGSTYGGYKWYTNGRVNKKINTFFDTRAAIQTLIKEKITTKKLIVVEGIMGGSLAVAGTLTVFEDVEIAAAILDYANVDILNNQLDSSLPHTQERYLEYGNPNDETVFKSIYKYDPIYKASKKNYPSIYVTGFKYSSHVNYWEGMKFVAQVRAKQTNTDNVVVFDYKPMKGVAFEDKVLTEEKDLYIRKIAFTIKQVKGWHWTDPLEWLWILISCIVLGSWMILFMLIFIGCEMLSKKKKEKEEKEGYEQITEDEKIEEQV